MRSIKLCGALVAIIFLFSFAAFAASEEAKKHYETAKSLYVAGDVDGAIAELEKALAIDPDYEQAKKLYEKIGGGKKKTGSVSTAAKVEIQPQTQVGASVMDRDDLKRSIAIVLSNSMGQIRGEIFALVSDTIRESFDELLRSAARNEVKAVLKQAIFEVMREVLAEEIKYSINVIKEEMNLPSSSGEVSQQLKIGNGSSVNLTSPSPSVSDSKAKARELYEKAIRLLDDENYSAARELLIEASKLDPNNPDIKKALSRIPRK